MAVIANPLPTMFADVSKLTAPCAIMVPTKLEEYPMEALVPMAQNTFDGLAPLISLKDVAVAVESVVLAWKIHWALVLPSASRVKAAAENSNVPVAEQYVPGVRSKPARSALWRVWFAVHVAPEAWLYRAARLSAQLFASAVLFCAVPASISYEPPMAVPGDTPTEPVFTTVFAPLKLTEVPARTAKAAHEPSTNGTSVVDMLATAIFFMM